ncbi:hypothetical protein AAH994_06065 [Weeksellaceae bacterium A-14]
MADNAKKTIVVDYTVTGLLFKGLRKDSVLNVKATRMSDFEPDSVLFELTAERMDLILRSIGSAYVHDDLYVPFSNNGYLAFNNADRVKLEIELKPTLQFPVDMEIQDVIFPVEATSFFEVKQLENAIFNSYEYDHLVADKVISLQGTNDVGQKFSIPKDFLPNVLRGVPGCIYDDGATIINPYPGFEIAKNTDYTIVERSGFNAWLVKK